MQATLQKQRGLTLTSMIVVGILLVIVVAFGMKVLPEVLDYMAVVKDMKAVAQDPSLRDASPADIRKAFDRRILIDNVSSINGSDLEIVKHGGNISINIAYSRKIPLFSNVSLVIDFEGSSGR